MAERLDDMLVSFSIELEAQQRSARTIVLYSQSVRLFGEWLTERGRPATSDELTRSALRAWLAELGQTREVSTCRLRFKGLQRFSRWAVEVGDLATDPTEGLELAQAPSKPVPILSDADLAALLKACAGPDFADRRDEAMVRLLLDCGVRVAELVGMTTDQVNLRERTCQVTGKGNRTRHVYFSAKTARALDRYLRDRRRHRYTDAQQVWLGERGPLSTDGVRYMLESRGIRAGIGPVNPHRFRHTFAHDFLVSGGQERDLKRLAGWSSDAMLERYGASAADHRAREAARRMNRGDRV